MRFAKTLLLLTCVLGLAACATAVQPRDQKITITAVNGQDPKCILETPLHKYVAYPPQSINVEREKHVLVVDCTANGGKHRRLLIEPEHNPTSSYLQGPLQLVDRVTGSAWQYPPYLKIDFEYPPFLDPLNPGGEPPATARGRHVLKESQWPRHGELND